MAESAPDISDVRRRAGDLYARGEDIAAEALGREALAARPADAQLWRTLAPLLLVQGKYREGFQAFEARGERLSSPLTRLSYPEWEGAPLAGRSILVGGEQGLGDEIQFARFVPQLRRLGASRITLTAASANVRALSQVGADQVIPRDAGAVAVPRHDCWVMLGSLPHRLGLTLETLSGAPYLRAEVTSRGGLGVVERGDPAHPNDANRSLPEGLLQQALPRAELLRPQGDVLDSLRRLAGFDLLITVDTSWAHMAGALGLPCRLLLPKGPIDWRWMRERRDSPWYASLTLYRQRTPGDWRELVRRATADLA